MFLGVERFAKQYIHFNNTGFMIRLIQVLGTFIVISLMWVVFRIDSFDTTLQFYNKLMQYTPDMTLEIKRAYIVGIVILGTLVWHGFTREKTLEERFTDFPVALKVIMIASAIIGIGLCSTGDNRAFIYFQF